MTSITTLKKLVFESDNKEDIESAIGLLVDKLNQLEENSKKKYFLGTIVDEGRKPIEIFLYDEY